MCERHLKKLSILSSQGNAKQNLNSLLLVEEWSRSITQVIAHAFEKVELVGVNSFVPTTEIKMQVPQNLEIDLIQDQDILLLGIYPNDT